MACIIQHDTSQCHASCCKAESVRALAAGLIDHTILATRTGVMIVTQREGFAMPYNEWHM